jgi:hypothetical protein
MAARRSIRERTACTSKGAVVGGAARLGVGDGLGGAAGAAPVTGDDTLGAGEAAPVLVEAVHDDVATSGAPALAAPVHPPSAIAQQTTAIAPPVAARSPLRGLVTCPVSRRRIATR